MQLSMLTVWVITRFRRVYFLTLITALTVGRA